MSEHDGTETDDPQAYDVTIFNPNDPRAGVSSAFVERVDAISKEDARDRVIETGDAPDDDAIIQVEPVVVRLRKEVRGTTAEIEDTIAEFDRVEQMSDAEVVVLDDDAYVRLEDADDTDAENYAVSDWHDVLMRVTGLTDGLNDGTGDGIDIRADQFADEDSVVEFMLGDDVLAKFTKERDSDG